MVKFHAAQPGVGSTLEFKWQLIKGEGEKRFCFRSITIGNPTVSSSICTGEFLQKAEISALWKTRKRKLSPNWTRKTVWSLIDDDVISWHHITGLPNFSSSLCQPWSRIILACVICTGVTLYLFIFLTLNAPVLHSHCSQPIRSE